jgi:hypothetical protein
LGGSKSWRGGVCPRCRCCLTTGHGGELLLVLRPHGVAHGEELRRDVSPLRALSVDDAQEVLVRAVPRDRIELGAVPRIACSKELAAKGLNDGAVLCRRERKHRRARRKALAPAAPAV